MKQQVFFVVLLFFSPMCSMDEPAKQGKLLFPFQRKTAKDVWHMVREDYIAHRYFLKSQLFKSLPREIKQFIQRLWFMLHNPPSFSTPEDQFFRKLLSACIVLSCKEKPSELPFHGCMTHSGKYSLKFVDNKLNIYCTKTKCTRTFTGIGGFLGCKKENLILCGERIENRNNFNKHSLYDIEQDRWHELGVWMHYSTVLSTQLIGGLDDKYLYIWDIANIDAIVCHKIPCLGREYRFMEFTSDGYILCGTGDQNLLLLTIENNKLKELARCDFQGLTFPFCELRMRSYGDDEYYILSSRQPSKDLDTTFNHQSLGIKIEKHNNGEFSLKKIFNVPFSVWSIIDKDAILTCNESGQISIANYSGQIIHTGDIINKFYFAHMGDHFFYMPKNSSSELKTCAIVHAKRDVCGEEIYFVRKIIENATMSFGCHRFNRKKNVFALKLVKEQDAHQQDINQKIRFGCFDFDAKNLISFDAIHCDFHPCGHALLCEKEDGTRKKLVLHPKGADDHFEKLAHKPLKLAQCAALEKVCSEVEKLRKALEQENKKPEPS